MARSALQQLLADELFGHRARVDEGQVRLPKVQHVQAQGRAHQAHIDVQALEITLVGFRRQGQTVGGRAVDLPRNSGHAKMPERIGDLGGPVVPADLSVLELASDHAGQSVEHHLDAALQAPVAVLVEVVPIGRNDALLNSRHPREIARRPAPLRSREGGDGFRQTADNAILSQQL